jgi:outer membrane protein assembly factor BamB
MAVSGSIIAVAAANRRLVAVSLDSARALWTAHLPGEAPGGVLAVGSRLYVGIGRPSGRIQARSLDGTTAWSTATEQITSPLASIGDMIMGMNRRGFLVALNATTGRIRWQRHVGASRTVPSDAGNGHVLATTMDSLVLFETSAGRVVARRAVSGVSLTGWQHMGPWLVSGTADSSVVALDPASLATAWTVRTDAPVLGPIAVAGDTAWAATRTGTIYQVTGGTPPLSRVIAELRWPLTSGIALIGPDLVVGGADGVLRGLNRDGSERWRVQVWPAVDVPPLLLPGGFAAMGGDGDLHRFSE